MIERLATARLPVSRDAGDAAGPSRGSEASARWLIARRRRF